MSYYKKLNNVDINLVKAQNNLQQGQLLGYNGKVDFPENQLIPDPSDRGINFKNRLISWDYMVTLINDLLKNNNKIRLNGSTEPLSDAKKNQLKNFLKYFFDNNQEENPKIIIDKLIRLDLNMNPEVRRILSKQKSGRELSTGEIDLLNASRILGALVDLISSSTDIKDQIIFQDDKFYMDREITRRSDQKKRRINKINNKVLNGHKLTGEPMPEYLSYSFRLPDTSHNLQGYLNNMFKEEGVYIQASGEKKDNAGGFKGSYFSFEPGDRMLHGLTPKSSGQWDYTLLFRSDALLDPEFGLDISDDNISIDGKYVINRTRENATAKTICLYSAVIPNGSSQCLVAFDVNTQMQVRQDIKVFNLLHKLFSNIQENATTSNGFEPYMINAVKSYDLTQNSITINSSKKVAHPFKIYWLDGHETDYFDLEKNQNTTKVENSFYQAVLGNNFLTAEELDYLYFKLTDINNATNFMFNEPELRLWNTPRGTNPIKNFTKVLIKKDYIEKFICNTNNNMSAQDILLYNNILETIKNDPYNYNV